jgi:sugar lactone lactonase YvrE
VYVVDSAHSKIHLIDVATNTVLDRTIATGATPRSIAITPDRRKIFVSNEQPVPTGSISVIELDEPGDNGRIVAELRDVACPQGLAMSRDGTRLFVASQCGGGNDPVFILDTRTHRVVSSISGLAVGVSVTLDPDDETLYAARGNHPCRKPDGGRGSPFSVVNIRERKIAHTICLDTSVNWIAVSRDGAFVFVANGSAISVFDGKRVKLMGAAALVHTIPLEGPVGGLAVAEDNSVYAWIPSTPRLFLYSPGIAP